MRERLFHLTHRAAETWHRWQRDRIRRIRRRIARRDMRLVVIAVRHRLAADSHARAIRLRAAASPAAERISATTEQETTE